MFQVVDVSERHGVQDLGVIVVSLALSGWRLPSPRQAPLHQAFGRPTCSVAVGFCLSSPPKNILAVAFVSKFPPITDSSLRFRGRSCLLRPIFDLEGRRDVNNSSPSTGDCNAGFLS
jgi:hypothetical protein